MGHLKNPKIKFNYYVKNQKKKVKFTKEVDAQNYLQVHVE